MILLIGLNMPRLGRCINCKLNNVCKSWCSAFIEVEHNVATSLELGLKIETFFCFVFFWLLLFVCLVTTKDLLIVFYILSFPRLAIFTACFFPIGCGVCLVRFTGHLSSLLFHPLCYIVYFRNYCHGLLYCSDVN